MEIHGGNIEPRKEFVQSANVFFHCTKKLKYLKEIIENRAIIPRYNEEDIKYLGIDDYNKIAFPMVCFCDIYLSKLKLHMKNYGFYGIGLDKNWGIDRGLQPIAYMNNSAQVNDDFSSAIQDGIKRFSGYNESTPEMDLYINQILTRLLFTKPLEGSMKFGQKTRKMNFHDEKEWRYIPDMTRETELPLLVPQKYMNGEAYNSYSAGMENYKPGWLVLGYESIKYLVVKNLNDRQTLIDFIIKKLDIEPNVKYVLISKILIYNEMEGDF